MPETTPQPRAQLPTGDLGLLDTDVAQELLHSTELARVAYVGPDAKPRVFPMLFHWTGDQVVLSTFGGAKVKALRERPDLAITVDRASEPPQALLVRGRAEITEVQGIVPEYRLAQERYAGAEKAAETLHEVDQPGLRMFRIALTPAWVQVLDFSERFPGENDADSFERRGR